MKPRRVIAAIPGATGAFRALRAGMQWLSFLSDFRKFSRMAAMEGTPALRWGDRLPVLGEATRATGFDRHYIYHTAWACRVLARTRPAHHVDISSSLYFVSLASAFLPITHLDYRPPELRLDGLKTGFADLASLSFDAGSQHSLSCMHVIEHIGLGRYGDPLDPKGDEKAIAELERVLAPGGQLLLVTPVGRPRTCFNAHRIYSFEQICAALHGLTLEEFKLVPDDPQMGGLVDATPSFVSTQLYACGCFLFRKS